MEYTHLSDTGVSVSKICLGTMTWGQQNTEQEAHEQLNYAIENGINFIDTAEMYAVPANPATQGLTEKYIGSWLKTQDRSKQIVATKIAGPSAATKHIRGGSKFNSEH
ncbi:MAG TPA: aldo/keto reductase, partial [Chitinophagales bacterium]|nr:aldo/keto reductase [Chitinophagales bacterium]